LARFFWVAAAAAVWCLMPQWGLWILVLAIVPWAVHAVGSGTERHPTAFDGALLLFTALAGTSLAAAYDPRGQYPVFFDPVGWDKFWGLSLALMLFKALTSLRMEAERRWAMRLFTGVGALVALWFVTTNNWDATSEKFAFVPGLGRLVQSLLPSLGGQQINPNVAGGLAALILPINLDSWARSARCQGEQSLFWTVYKLASTAMMGLALLLSSSRGAWLGLVGALGLTAIWRLTGWMGGDTRRVAVFLGLVAAAALVGGSILTVSPPLRTRILESEAFGHRVQIFLEAVLLVRDYPFTGCGLGQFPLVHSTYSLLIHVPVLVYAHATALGVAVEQGLPAALTLVGVWTGAAWTGMRALARSKRAPMGLVAGLLGLVVLNIHGLFDSVIYGTRALALLWLPVGLIAGASREIAWRMEDSGRQRVVRWSWRGLAAAAATVLVIGSLFWRPLAAGWHANLGAVKQTLVELRAYDWRRFDDPTLDEVRRQEDLSAAVAHFERALAFDSEQRTARTRLAQIALARGAYREGLAHARAAWEAGHRDRVTRLVLGEALVAQGRVDQAVSVVRGLERAATRFDGQAFYRYWTSQDWQRAAYAWRAVLRLDPENERVRKSVEYAEEKMAQQH
jgi:O-antigen ligase